MSMVDPRDALLHTEQGARELSLEAMARDAALAALPDGRGPRKTNASRTRAEIWERRMQMASMQAQGKYLRTIAKYFGVDVTTITNEVGALVSEYRAEALKSVGERVAAEEALIYSVQLEAIQAWFESKEGKHIHSTKKVRELRGLANFNGRGKGKSFEQRFQEANVDQTITDDLDELFGVNNGGGSIVTHTDDLDSVLADDSMKQEESTRVEVTAGDPAFLRLILDCSAMRAKYHGWFDKVDGAGSKLEDENLQAWTPQQRASRLASLLEKARLGVATQKAIGAASVEAVNQQPLGSLFSTRASELAEGKIPTKASPFQSQYVIPITPKVKEQEGDPDWDAA